MRKMISTGESRQRKLIKGILVNWQLYLFVLPVVAYLIIFRYVPIYGIQIAFKSFKAGLGIWGSPWVGLDNFVRFFNSYYFVTVLKNTLSITIISLIMGFPAPVLLALSLNEISHLGYKKTIQTVTFAPHFISTVVMCGMLIIFLNPSTGIFNHLIAAAGGERINFMQEAALFKWIYVLSGVWQEAGWGAIIYFAALSGVSPELLECARIDGANKWQRIIHINLPVLLPTIIIMLILRCGSLLSVGYEKIFLLQNSLNLSASEVISTYVYKTGLIKADYSFSTAVDLFNSLVNAVLLLLVNFFSRKFGETSLW